MNIRISMALAAGSLALFGSAFAGTLAKLTIQPEKGDKIEVSLNGFSFSRSHDLSEFTETNFRRYRPGRPVFGNITMETGVADPGLDAWLNDITDGKVERRSGSIVILDNDSATEKARYNFFEAWPCRWKYPACDANDRSPSFFHVEFECAQIKGDLSRGSQPDRTRQKQWLPANFRLKIEGLDEACKRVNKIEAISVHQISLGDLDGDGLGDYRTSDLDFTLPAADAMAFEPWFQDGGQPRLATIDYLDKKDQSMRTLFMSACVYKVTPNFDEGTVNIRCAVIKTKTKSNQSND